jgi:superfamily II DNA helicase RecQ
MCLRHPEFRKWLTSQNTTDNILAVIIDEAHCISQWGGDFRPDYAKIEKIRALLTLGIPFLATSATLALPALRDINSKLHIDINTSYFINLGNDRPNISTEVHEINGSTDFNALFTYFPVNASSPDDLKKTIIFTNVVNHTQKICRELRKQFGPRF